MIRFVLIAACVVIGAGVVFGLAPRRRRATTALAPIDAFTLADPWRRAVQNAQRSQSRFRRAVAARPAGPTTDRLNDIGDRIDAVVNQIWEVAQSGHRIGVATRLSVPGSTQQLAEQKAEIAGALTTLSDRLDAAVATGIELSATDYGAEDRIAVLSADLTGIDDQLVGLRAATSAVQQL